MTESIINTLIQSVSTIGVAIIGAFGAFKLKNNKSQKLKYHPVFAKIEFNKDIVDNFEFRNKGKEIIFKDILEHHLNIYNDILSEFAKEIDKDYNIDQNELANRAYNVVSDIREAVSGYYITDSSYNNKEKKALDIVIEKYNNWNFNRDKNMVEMISHVCGSSFYNTTYTKAVTILDLFLFSMAEMIEDANKTLNSLNGDLKGLVFKGVEI